MPCLLPTERVIARHASTSTKRATRNHPVFLNMRATRQVGVASASDRPSLDAVTKQPEDTSASDTAATNFASGPQGSIHTSGEHQSQHTAQDVQQAAATATAAATSSAHAGPTASPAGSPDAAAIAAANEETSAVNRLDIYKAIGISGTVCVLAGILDHAFVETHQGLSMALLFCLGYLGIFVEEVVGLNKAGVALVMAVSLWTIHSNAGPQVEGQISLALASVSELIFFILGAMTVVEVVDAHGGFKRLAAWVRADQRQALTWFIALLTFAMSAVLDNLTTTIVMVSILQRAVPEDPEFRRLLGAIVVVAANAGGAWTPIGDVTTTMLWIHGQISPWATIRDLLLPSLISVAVPVAAMCSTTPELQGPVGSRVGTQQKTWQVLPAAQPEMQQQTSSKGLDTAAPAEMQLAVSNRDVLVLSVGLGALLFVPLFKHLTGLPPYLGMLSGLGVLWMVTDALHFGESKSYPRVQDALRNLDIGGVMFFLGILLSVEALNAAGLLQLLAVELNAVVPDVNLVAAAIGLASAVIDNVPLVAATMGMYDISQVPQDAQLWQLIALCAGTGGSLLVIGSAAGVAYMGLEGVGFGWYMQKVTPWVLLGYGAAIACYISLHGLAGPTVQLPG